MNKIYRNLLIAALAIAPATLSAQNEMPQKPEEGQRPPMGEMREPGKKPTLQQIAHKITDEMDRELDLTDKQYQKIYKLNLKELKEAEADSLYLGRGGMQPGFGPRPGMGPGPRPGGPGMGPGMGERPEKQEFQPLTETQMKELREAHEKARIKKDKKMRKILTDEQYYKWIRSEQARLSKMHNHRHGGPRPDGAPAPGSPDGPKKDN